MDYNNIYWQGACCDFCGSKTQGKVYLKLITPIYDEDMTFPYEEFNFCEKCFKEIDIKKLITGIRNDYKEEDA